MNDFFNIGKLYKTTEEAKKRGLGSHLLYKPPGEAEGYLSEEHIFLILDKLYVQRTKRRNSSTYPHGITLRMWHLKVLIDKQIGYISVWEDEWEEIKE